MNMSLREFIEKYKNGHFESTDIQTMIDAGWYDWFCDDKSLKKRLDRMFPKLLQVSESSKINPDSTFVFFKNNCPGVGSLYDDFRICDLKSGEVIYTIVPSSGHKSKKGKSELWGRENDFQKPLVTGTWKDVKVFFGKGEGA